MTYDYSSDGTTLTTKITLCSAHKLTQNMEDRSRAVKAIRKIDRMVAGGTGLHDVIQFMGLTVAQYNDLNSIISLLILLYFLHF